MKTFTGYPVGASDVSRGVSHQIFEPLPLPQYLDVEAFDGPMEDLAIYAIDDNISKPGIVEHLRAPSQEEVPAEPTGDLLVDLIRCHG